MKNLIFFILDAFKFTRVHVRTRHNSYRIHKEHVEEQEVTTNNYQIDKTCNSTKIRDSIY